MEVFTYPQRMWLAASPRLSPAHGGNRLGAFCLAVFKRLPKIPGFGLGLLWGVSLLSPIAGHAANQETQAAAINSATSALPPNPEFELVTNGVINDWQLEPATAIPADGKGITSTLKSSPGFTQP